MRNQVISSALLCALLSVSSTVLADSVLFEDDFTRPSDTINDPGGNWILNSQFNTPALDTNPSPQNDVQIITGTVGYPTPTSPSSQRLFFNSAGQPPITIFPNNNDTSNVYNSFDLDARQDYTVNFKFAEHHLSTYPLSTDNLTASQVSGGFFIEPRAQGNDLVGNFGWQISRANLTNNAPLVIRYYTGDARTGSPAFIAPGQTVDVIPSSLVVDTEFDAKVVVSKNVALLYFGGVLVDERKIGTNYNNGTADHLMFGYNALATAQRRQMASVDNVLVTAPDALSPGFAVTWKNTPGGGDGINWDLTSSNWNSARPGDPFKYHDNDAVSFTDDNNGKFTVNLNTIVRPASVNFNTAGTYTLQGTGAITQGKVTKDGAGTLIIATDNTNGDGLDINAGTVQIGNGGTTGRIGAGDVLNNGTLIINRSNATFFTNAISGTGSVNLNGAGTISLEGPNTFGGGLNVNAGGARLTVPTAAGTGTITAASGTSLGFGGGTYANPVVASGITLGAIGTAGDSTLSGNLTPSGNVTAYTVDPRSPDGTSRSLILTGALTGSVNINVINSTAVGVGNVTPDAQQGLRLRGTGASNYSGTITVNQAAKLELQTTNASPFSPAGTGKIVLTGGAATGTGNQNGNYSELTLRNNTTGNVTLGNNVELAGTGLAVINPVTDNNQAPANSIITMGNLKIGSGQEISTFKNTTNATPLTVAFQSVTLTGNGARFSAKRPAFGNNANDAGDLALGPIGVAAGLASAGITISGASPRAVILNGANTYNGDTNVASGILRLGAADRIPDASNMILGNNSAQSATFDTGGVSEQLGTLKVQGAVPSIQNGPGILTVDLGAPSSVPSNLRFAASANQVWTGLNQLNINNYEQDVDHIFFGTTNTGPNTGLGVSQLRRIIINGQEVNLAANGELVVAAAPAASLTGDVNHDSHVDAADIRAMISALADLSAYATTTGQFTSDVAVEGDVNNDGRFSNHDIQALLGLLNGGGGSTGSVPEPATITLAALGGLVLVVCRANRRRKLTSH